MTFRARHLHLLCLRRSCITSYQLIPSIILLSRSLRHMLEPARSPNISTLRGELLPRRLSVPLLLLGIFTIVYCVPS